MIFLFKKKGAQACWGFWCLPVLCSTTSQYLRISMKPLNRLFVIFCLVFWSGDKLSAMNTFGVVIKDYGDCSSFDMPSTALLREHFSDHQLWYATESTGTFFPDKYRIFLSRGSTGPSSDLVDGFKVGVFVVNAIVELYRGAKPLVNYYDDKARSIVYDCVQVRYFKGFDTSQRLVSMRKVLPQWVVFPFSAEIFLIIGFLTSLVCLALHWRLRV